MPVQDHDHYDHCHLNHNHCHHQCDHDHNLNSSSEAQIILQKLYKPFKSPQGKFMLQTAHILLIHPFRYQKKLPIKAQYAFQALEDSVLEDDE